MIKQALALKITNKIAAKAINRDTSPPNSPDGVALDLTDMERLQGKIDRTVREYKDMPQADRQRRRETGGLLDVPVPYTMAPDISDLEKTYGLEDADITYHDRDDRWGSYYNPTNAVDFTDADADYEDTVRENFGGPASISSNIDDPRSSAILAHEMSHAESVGHKSMDEAALTGLPYIASVLIAQGLPSGLVAGYLYNKFRKGAPVSSLRRAIHLGILGPGFAAGHTLHTGGSKGKKLAGLLAALGLVGYMPTFIEETKANTRASAVTTGYETNDSEDLSDKMGDLATSQLSYTLPALVLAYAAKKGLGLTRASIAKALQRGAGKVNSPALNSTVAAGLRPAFA